VPNSLHQWRSEGEGAKMAIELPFPPWAMFM